jgi:hypothetical protein
MVFRAFKDIEGKMGQAKKNRDMNRQDLLKFLRELEPGTRIPGAITGKTFKFGGLKTHSGRGHFPHMKGELVVSSGLSHFFPFLRKIFLPGG